MTAVPEIDVDLAPEERWTSLRAWRSSAHALLRFYVMDLGGLELFGPILRSYCEDYVDEEYATEMRGIARVLDAPEEEVVLANLYYDALKFLLDGSASCPQPGLDYSGRVAFIRNRRLQLSTRTTPDSVSHRGLARLHRLF